MNTTESELTRSTKRVVGVQVIVSIIVAGLFLIKSPWASLSGFYGGIASVVVALLLSQRIKRATEAAQNNLKESMAILYIGAVQRFALVAVFLVIGIAIIKFDPIAVCAGFAIAQLSFVMGSRTKPYNKRGQQF